MISDSPYHVDRSMLTPWAGMATGLVAAMVMIVLIALLQPVSGLGWVETLIKIGRVFLPLSAYPIGDGTVALIGLGFHFFLGALLGMFYAICQQRIPARGLITVGIFYGFVIWVAGGLFIGPLFGADLLKPFRSWPWLLACLFYGLCLAVGAIWSEKRKATITAILPKD
jgi:hypothetical protein